MLPLTPRKPSLSDLCRASGGFVIGAPPFVAQSAGVRGLYVLGQDLRRRGFAAFMWGGVPGFASGDAAVVSDREARRLCANGFVAVYPETVYGNPLGAKTVVRWVLNRPGLLGGNHRYHPTELVFVYSQVYRAYVANPTAGNLYMPLIDESLFWTPAPGSTHRDLECFYIGKSRWQPGIIDRGRTLEITRSWPDRSELGKLLRRARALYCFDNSTMLIYEALLCGCPVTVIPDGTQRWEDYLELELGVEGITWGAEGFTPGEFDPRNLHLRLAQARATYEKQLDGLVRIVSQRAPLSPCPAFAEIAEVVLRDSQPTRLQSTVSATRDWLKQTERTFRKRRRAFVRDVFGRWLRPKAGRLVGRIFDAAAVPVPPAPPGPRFLDCHVVRRGAEAGTAGFDDASIVLDPDAPLDPRNLALLLTRVRCVVLTDPWPSLRHLALRCGCEVTEVMPGGRVIVHHPAHRTIPVPTVDQRSLAELH